MLESYIKEKLETKKILLMTHIVMGYPTLEASFEMIGEMVDAGVDLMELQIPFSEPMADGPVIVKANQQAIDNGTRVADCFRMAQKAARTFPIPFLFMTYANILFRQGMNDFARVMAEMDIQGAIVPDLPPEEGGEYLAAMAAHQRHPIFIFSPQTRDSRMARLSDLGSGFVYCMARTGVTGGATRFSTDTDAYLARCRQATSLPLAVGFGIKERADVQYLTGKAEIAVVGSQTLRVAAANGVEAVGPFIRCLFP